MFVTDIGGRASTKKSFQLHNACMYLPSARCLLLQSRALLYGSSACALKHLDPAKHVLNYSFSSTIRSPAIS